MQLHVAPTFTDTGRAPWHFKGKSNRGFRSPEQVTAIVVHQTAVNGGFGAPDLEARAIRYGGTSMARRGTPYHYVYSAQDIALVAVWHPRLYSYHGDSSNAYSVGFAIDGRFPGHDEHVASQPLIEEATRLMIEHLHGLGFVFVQHSEAHRQHSAARTLDPGGHVWAAVERAAKSFDIRPRPQHTTKPRRGGQGLSLPDWWRP